MALTNEEQPFSSILKDLFQSVYDLVQSELRLAKAELKHNTKDVLHQVQSIGISAVIAWLGAQVLLAFAVIGLGSLIGNYWLSALIIGLLLFIPGSLMTVMAIKRVRIETSLPASRSSLRNDYLVTSRKVQDIAEATRKRAS
jgi:uncharacterized membrane protein YqjE